MKHFLLLPSTILIGILFFSCEKKLSKNTSQITSDLVAAKTLKQIEADSTITIGHEKHEFIPYNEFNKKLKHIKYIPIKSKEPIGEIEKLIIGKGMICLLDAYVSERIFLFDLNGESIKVVNSKGAGPEEYHGLSDISFSDDNIVVNDRLALQMLYFSQNGEFVKKTKGAPGFYFESFEGKVINQMTFGQSYDDNINYHLGISVNDSILSKAFPFYPIQNNAVNSRSLHYNYKNELLFSPTLSDTIYKINTDSSYSIKYIVEQEKSIWSENMERLEAEQYRDLVKHNSYTHLDKPILETENFVYFPICYGKESYIQQQSNWYDKRTKTSFTISDPKSDDPVYNILTKPIAIYENYYVGVIDNYHVINIRDFVKKQNKDERLINEEIIKIVENYSNDLECILVLYEFK